MTVYTLADEQIKNIAYRLRQSKHLLAVTHMNPDGDALGSLAALSHIAKALDIDVRLYCESPVPDFLDWVPFASPPVQSMVELESWLPDTVIFLDCADASRAGREMADFTAACKAKQDNLTNTVTICVDHHAANPLFADINWVDASMSATGVMVALLARELSLPLAGELGEAIYLAMVADTGSFSFANTSALTLELAAEIVGNGLLLADFYNKYENNWSLNRMHLWGALMRKVEILCNGKIVVSIVSQERLKKYGGNDSDLEGYASWLRRLKGTKVVILSRTRNSGSKISLRSMGDVDVQAIASVFGGGGHKGAAGIDMNEPPVEATNKVLEEVCRTMGEDPHRICR